MTVVNILPDQCRHLQSGALLAVMADPMLAVDGKGLVLLTNLAFSEHCRHDPVGERPASLLNDETLEGALVERGFRLPLCGVTFMGQALLLDATPITEGPDEGERHLAGDLPTLYEPDRIGKCPTALHHGHAEGFEALLGDSQLIRTLETRTWHVAALDAPLPIHDETGTDKELAARDCHALSARHNSPFLVLNCVALPENLVESGLFNYAPGAFTGAQRGGESGLLELAYQGMVFLDEISKMPPYLQVKLLRFLNDGGFRRVDGDHEVRVGMWIPSATHHNLGKMVAEGNFREGPFYRLNVLNLEVPPLRERDHDILLLTRHFVQQACAQIQHPVCRLTSGTYPALLSNRWLGNMRQLRNVIFRAATICESNLVDIDDLEIAGTAMARQNDGEVGSLEGTAEGFEKTLLEKLYVSCPSTRQLAARPQTLHTAIAHRLCKYGIGPCA